MELVSILVYMVKGILDVCPSRVWVAFKKVDFDVVAEEASWDE